MESAQSGGGICGLGFITINGGKFNSDVSSANGVNTCAQGEDGLWVVTPNPISNHWTRKVALLNLWGDFGGYMENRLLTILIFARARAYKNPPSTYLGGSCFSRRLPGGSRSVVTPAKQMTSAIT